MENETRLIGDSWETPADVWQAATRDLPRFAIIWDPFYCCGRSNIYLQDLGFMTVNEAKCEDLLPEGKCECMSRETPHCHIIATNPPFSQLEYVLPWLHGKDKPTMVLMPKVVTTREWFKDLTKEWDLEVRVPKKRVHFIREGEYRPNCQFDTVWCRFNWRKSAQNKRKR